MASTFIPLSPRDSAFCSWSGGKDSCLALHRAARRGIRVSHLANMLIEDGSRSRSHGLRREVIEAQAAALGLPLVTAATSWAGYEEAFIGMLRGLWQQGVSAGVFGDIEGAPNRAWEEKVCAAAGMQAILPVWQEPRDLLLAELVDAGLEAIVVAANSRLLPPEILGRRLDRTLADELVALGVDACGENGEYHTVVVNGPLFSAPVRLQAGERVLRDGYWFLDLAVV